MSLAHYDRATRRVYILKNHIHHGFTGLVLIAIGAVLAVHDRRDAREWFHG